MFLPLTPIRFLHRAMDLFGRHVGVVCGGTEYTYREFGERTERLASALRKQGLQPGDRVAYLSFNNHQLLEGYYGVIQAKAVVMPLNVRLSPQELIGILNHSGARMLIFENDFLPIVEALRKHCPEIRHFVTLNEPVPLADTTYEEILSLGEAGRTDFTSIDEMSTAELFYTSGSTGTPKGVALSHRTLYLHALSTATLFPSEEKVVDLHTIPLFHANGWGRPQCSTMLGYKQVMVRRFDPAGVLRLIEHYRATHMSLVPTMANALLMVPDIGAYDLKSLRQVMIGGAASSPELLARLEKALGCECISGYGLTETAPVLTTARRKSTVQPVSEEDRYRRQAMAGWPVPGVELRVVDASGASVPQDMQTIGEIVTRSDHVMEGYFREPAATEAVMTDGWFHTGDMAVWDEEGFVQIVDRKKEIIISGGENISSIEVERALASHPEVFEVAVVSAPDEKWGEVPVAIVVRKPESKLTADQLLEFAAGRLGRFKLPRAIEFQDEPLPKTGTGKIRKLLLRERFWSGKEKRVQG